MCRISQALKKSYIVYSDAAKENILKVDSSLLKRYTAVSPQVAEAMAKNLFQMEEADYADIPQAIAGPGDRDTGLMYLALYNGKEFVLEEKRYRGEKFSFEEGQQQTDWIYLEDKF